MQLSDIRHEDYEETPSPAGGWLKAQLSVLIGLALLAGVGFAFVALATWSVDDPSLSNANGNITRNFGGFAGSSIADLFMQFTGLASVIVLVAPACWGWLKLGRRPVTRLRARIIVWAAAIACSSALVGLAGKPENWPLPTGTGGVIGDLLLGVPTMFTGTYPSGLLAVLLAILLAPLAVFLNLFAGGLIARRTGTEELIYDAETGEILDEDDAEGESGGIVLGALTHWYFLARTWVRGKPAKGAKPAKLAANKPGLVARLKTSLAELLAPPDDGLELYDEGVGASEPYDPGYEVENGDYLRAPEAGPGYGEEIRSKNEPEFAEGEDWSPAEAPQTDEPAQARVQPMKTRLQQGARVNREAQTSFIDADRFELPALNFLSEGKKLANDGSLSNDALEQNARLLEGVLEDFGVKGEIINVRPGPVVTLYELEPAAGVKSARVIGLAEDIARSMSAIACRVAVVPGRNAIGIELPNSRRETVYLRELLSSKDYETTKGKLSLVLGKTIGGEPVIADLAKMPHLLVAGTTGSGKSVAINTMILSVLYRLSPEQVKLIMIDPKMLELSIYDGIPHLLTPVVTDPKKAVVALKWTVREMEERYKQMSKLGVRNIDGFNTRLEQALKKGENLSRTVQTGYDRDTGEAIYETEELNLEPMPYIVVIIDEMADLMMVAGKDIEGAIQRLAQMARAAGIHVIMATQRPSVDVITGTIKANFPTRISFQVTSKIDSRTILGEQGAEQLLGMGDMLYMAGGGRIQRVHGPFVSDEEVEKVVGHLKTQGVPQYLDSVTEEDEEDAEAGGSGTDGDLSESNDIYDQAVAVVLRDRKVSTSYIQRRLGIGYNRAATLIERMENEGLIGAANHAGKREILVPAEDETI